MSKFPIYLLSLTAGLLLASPLQVRAAESKFDVLEECGPSIGGGGRRGGGVGWTRSYSGVLKNGQFKSVKRYTDEDDGGQQVDEMSMRLTPDGLIQFDRKGNNSISGERKASYSGKLSQGQKTVKLSSEQSSSNGRVRSCTVQISFTDIPTTTVANQQNQKQNTEKQSKQSVVESKITADNKTNTDTKLTELNENLKQANQAAEKAKAEQELLKAKNDEAKSQLQAANNSAQEEIEKLKKQIADQQQKGSRITAADQYILSTKIRLESLKLSANSNKEIETAIRTDYDLRIKTQIQQLKSRISLLTTAKVTAGNAEEIKFLQSQIAILANRSLEDEAAFKQLITRTEELSKNAAQLKRDIASEFNNFKNDIDTQRRQDFEYLTNTSNEIIGLVESTNQAIQKDVAEIKEYTQSEVNKIRTELVSLDSKIVELQKNQQKLAEKQIEVEKQQAATDKRLTTTNQILANLILPISERPEDWMMRVAAVPVQQQQFCRIVDRFYDDLDNVYKTRNDIKKNALFRDRHQDLAALLPGGAINSWIVRVIEVTQAPDGSAAVLLQPPCRAMLGSDACGSDQKKIRATIPPKSLMYRELSRVNTGDFVTISGKIIYAQESYADQPLPQYALYQAGKHCTDVSGAKSQDVFVTELTNLAVLK